MELFKTECTIEEITSKQGKKYVVAKINLDKDYVSTIFLKDAEKVIATKSSYIKENTTQADNSDNLDFSNFA